VLCYCRSARTSGRRRSTWTTRIPRISGTHWTCRTYWRSRSTWTRRTRGTAWVHRRHWPRRLCRYTSLVNYRTTHKFIARYTLCLSVSVCPSVRLTHAGIVSKRLMLSSMNQRRTLADMAVFCYQSSCWNSTFSNMIMLPTAGA